MWAPAGWQHRDDENSPFLCYSMNLFYINLIDLC